MDNIGFHQEWYGKDFRLLEQHPGYSVISYGHGSKGILYDCGLFPGINLVFMDFNCKSPSSSARRTLHQCHGKYSCPLLLPFWILSRAKPGHASAWDHKGNL